MEKGTVNIRIEGTRDGDKLSPSNYDIKEIALMLEMLEDLLYPNSKSSRPVISYEMKKGSVLHSATVLKQKAVEFNAVIKEINEQGGLSFLDKKTAKAFERIQKIAKDDNLFFDFTTSESSNDFSLKINKRTNYIIKGNIWVDAEYYFYGVLTNAGGKDKANIHLDTEEHGSLTIKAHKDYLKSRKENPLYKTFGARAIGKQNALSGEIDKKSLVLLELFEHNPKPDMDYLQAKINKAKNKWSDIDPEKWIREIRGDYD